MHTTRYPMGGLGLFGLPCSIASDGSLQSVINICVGILISVTAAFVLTWVTYRDEPAKAKVEAVE